MRAYLGSSSPPWGLSFVAFMSMQGPALAVPTQFLAGRAAAAGIAAMRHHHDVQRLYRTLLDGSDKRRYRQLLAGAASNT